MITIQQEKVDDVFKEIQTLYQAHYEEIANDKDKIELNPDIDAYRQYENFGALIIIAVRDAGKLIGYSIFVLQKSLHYKQLVMAVNDLIYLSPDYRGKALGLKLLKESEKILKQKNANVIFMRTKVHADFGKLLERADYTPTEIVHRKIINNPKGGK